MDFFPAKNQYPFNFPAFERIVDMDIDLEIFRGSIIMSNFSLILLSLVAVFLLAACTSESPIVPGGIDYGNNQPTEGFEIVNDDFETTIDPENLPSREANPCPSLDSQLYQLTQSEDPLSMASQMGLKVNDDKVQVLFVLANEDIEFLEDYEVELGTQSGSQVQGYAPIDRLCEIAKIETVLTIRPVNRIY